MSMIIMYKDTSSLYLSEEPSYYLNSPQFIMLPAKVFSGQSVDGILVYFPGIGSSISQYIYIKMTLTIHMETV